MKTGIIDYGAGNLQSVRNALQSLGHDPVWIRDGEEIADFRSQISDLPNQQSQISNLKSSILILPGQGEFGDSVRNLRERGLFDPIRDWLAADRPYFGICLGYQLLFEGSDEAPGTPGFGTFAGRNIRFDAASGLKIPHMGWNRLELAHPDDPLWRGLPAEPHAYFVHSYYPAPQDPAITACTTGYGGDFVSAVRRGNLVATQFHPEKSQAVGLRILENFLDTVPATLPA